MSRAKRVTVYLAPDLYRILRKEAAETGQSLSKVVNEAVRESLEEDAYDLATIRARAREPRIKFETVLRRLRRRGKL